MNKDEMRRSFKVGDIICFNYKISRRYGYVLKNTATGYSVTINTGSGERPYDIKFNEVIGSRESIAKQIEEFTERKKMERNTTYRPQRSFHRFANEKSETVMEITTPNKEVRD